MALPMRITCEFRLEASHRLWRDDWPPDRNERTFGKCARLHGHSYRLLVTLRGAVDPETAMVRNFLDVKEIVRAHVVSRLDHQDMNTVIGGIPTAERILEWIARQLLPVFGPELYALELWETATASASLGPEELAALRAERTAP